MKERTTIQLEKEIKKDLAMRKKYSRETYNELIKRLIEKDKRVVNE